MTTTLIVHLDGGIPRARACLEALASLDANPSFEAIVVDDASPDLTPLLDALEGDVRTIRNPRPLGLAASATLAAAQATTDTLVLLRDAPLLAPDALAPLLDALGETDLAGAAALSVPTPANPGPSSPDAPGNLPHPVTTQALAFRRADADALAAAAGPAATTPALELAAICTELAARGRLATIPASVAAPSPARAISARSAPGEAAELTVVIPTLDAASERVRACIAAVQNTTDAAHQIVVVDNGAPPQGFTAPVNAGLRAVETPYAVVMNDDVEPLPGWWPPLRAALVAGAAVSFPLTVAGGMREDFAAWCFALSADTIEEMSHAPGQFFDPALRVWFQDTDLLARLRALGNPPRLVRESRIRHALSATVRSEDPQLRAWIERTIAEDRAAFLRKHPDYAGAVPA
ncbi:MAG TPA: glycosyltransferase [Solirubrobacterales bacterium]|nr:glycosyltransferase [Solirubrobacterales bacterium]